MQSRERGEDDLVQEAMSVETGGRLVPCPHLGPQSSMWDPGLAIAWGLVSHADHRPHPRSLETDLLFNKSPGPREV